MLKDELLILCPEFRFMCTLSARSCIFPIPASTMLRVRGLLIFSGVNTFVVWLTFSLDMLNFLKNLRFPPPCPPILPENVLLNLARVVFFGSIFKPDSAAPLDVR